MSIAWQKHSRDPFVTRDDGLGCVRGIVYCLKWLGIPWLIVMYWWVR